MVDTEPPDAATSWEGNGVSESVLGIIMGRKRGDGEWEPRSLPAIAERELVFRTRWLIASRWLAAIGVLAVPLVAHYAFGVGFSVAPVIIISAAMAVCNALFLLFYRLRLRTRRQRDYRMLLGFANVQICIDLMLLTILIHYTGGVENPFLFFYVFHMIISSILLPPFNAYLQATYATTLFVGLVALEFCGIIPHVKLDNYLPTSYYDQPQVVVGVCAALVSSLYLSVFMGSSIVKSLRRNQAELQEAYRNLRSLSTTRSVLFREASHELRAPLAAMRSCLDVVLGGHVGELNEKQRDMVQRTHSRIDYLLDLVSDLLQLSSLRTTTQLVTVEDVGLAEITQDAMDLLAESASDKKVALTNSLADVSVEGDTSALRQMMTNLISNAIKYNRDGGRVEVSGRITGETLVFEVTDSGIGMTREEADKVFHEFYRTPKARETVKIGTGVGLAIVKRVVEMHHGEIDVESEPDRGTTFRVELPLDQP